MRKSAKPAGNTSDLQMENKRLAAEIERLEQRNNSIEHDLWDLESEQDAIAGEFAHFVAELLDRRGPLPFSLWLQVESICDRLGALLPSPRPWKTEERQGTCDG